MAGAGDRQTIRNNELVGFYPPAEPALPPDHGQFLIYLSIVLSAAVQPAVLVNGVPIGNAALRGLRVADRPPGDCKDKPALLT